MEVVHQFAPNSGNSKQEHCVEHQIEESRIFNLMLEAEEGHETALAHQLELYSNPTLEEEQAREENFQELLNQTLLMSLSAIGESIDYCLENEQKGEECKICFEDLGKGQHATRMDCMCLYHSQCIKGWWKEDKKQCPIHRL
eukprot:TRINITY_DN2739_c0_g1_i1.p1 TRINITY_DN2739_c0_g1~~TRINITY_DN2739_c0_g1_i1.p1  ORF type:complete len:142 (+),score=39.72 TRINITY_DN2739_c0_g1_i1:93-518(+)